MSIFRPECRQQNIRVEAALCSASAGKEKSIDIIQAASGVQKDRSDYGKGDKV